MFLSSNIVARFLKSKMMKENERDMEGRSKEPQCLDVICWHLCRQMLTLRYGQDWPIETSFAAGRIIHPDLSLLASPASYGTQGKHVKTLTNATIFFLKPAATRNIPRRALQRQCSFGGHPCCTEPKQQSCWLSRGLLTLVTVHVFTCFPAEVHDWTHWTVIV
jgi:hypothetical protein